MSYKTYENYKYSGLNWIGDIPSHWETHRIKDFLSFKIGGTPSTSNESFFEGNNIWVSISDLNNNDNEFIYDSSVKISDEAIRSSNVKLISKGSLLYSFKLSVGLTAFAGCELYTNEAIASFEPNEFVDLNFLKYVFQVGFENNAVENIYGAKLFNMELIKLASFSMPIEKTEQTLIANFLDKKTSEIDVNIAKNKELISLLEEKKVSLINQVVTKGLYSNVPMKDSGIEWIGQIPEHWKVEKIKHISQVKPSNVDKKTKQNELSVLLCNYTDVYNNEFITKDLDFMKATATYDQIRKLSLKIGDIIITKDSESAEDIAVPAIVTEDLENVVCGYHLSVIRPDTTKIYPKFLFRSFESDKINKQFEHSSNGVTRFGLGSYPISNAYICLPQMNEQKEISKYLDNETSKISKTIDKINEHINFLEEYKTSLIHHVVTGKIDVRNEI